MFPVAKAIAARRCHFNNRHVITRSIYSRKDGDGRQVIIELVDHTIGDHHTNVRSGYESEDKERESRVTRDFCKSILTVSNLSLISAIVGEHEQLGFHNTYGVYFHQPEQLDVAIIASRRQPDSGPEAGRSQARSTQATGEDFVADSATQTSTARDALHPEPEQRGVRILAWSRARRRLSHQGQKDDTTAAAALPVCTVQDRFHAGVEDGKGQARRNGSQ